MKSILIIEDDPDIALSLKYNLERNGPYQVDTAEDGVSGLRKAERSGPDLVLLDLNLPGMDGLEVCRKIRERRDTSSTAIIMLTARTDETQKIEGLDAGADDYVSKPFSVRELLARVRAQLRRAELAGNADEQESVLRSGATVVDLEGRRVKVDDALIELTRKEFDLLTALLRNRGRVLTRNRLLEHVWGYDYPGETRTVDVHIRRLRQKLGEDAGAAIETVVGVGYRYRGES
ncbi:MAG: response regulator transcription factor [Acidobacteria bacterium]|uniref:Phosphate regulon transcriptional regulatory protein PhoB n=1 Tax=Candidatus Polarisedimenticola svalbardensis TaxID=2886004 RepID=A0A8J7CM33_9BACT|nr:response regulator transcription factor [Candidatus Polarisedimenticola svalbardensis]